MDSTIRRVAPPDYDRIRELFTEGDEMNLAAMPHVFKRADSTRRRRDEYFDLMLADDHFEFLVAEDAGRVVGFLQAHIVDARRAPNLVDRQTLFIDVLLVTEDSRKSGAGKALMDGAHAWGRLRSATDVELNVYEFNEGALAFYDRLGYVTSSRRLWRDLPE